MASSSHSVDGPEQAAGPDPAGAAHASRLRATRRAALIGAIGFVVSDLVIVAVGEANLVFMIASITSGLFFLVLLYALVSWGYLRSVARAARLDAELDAQEITRPDPR
ncbi:hypothetical protein C0Z11_07120 [Acidipropionibacterium jensenii]|uniref:hypothetical protein n=1 Tax=Acidipropionibacterium jensenii TaxID=1749 RepID=UPI000BC2FF23|nr:hypothetical protein [Acidipropionibacterium jensenii]AZZ42086.1 hypothetical protein C0Z11_07120 [Acidipropionibacterium jensenii]